MWLVFSLQICLIAMVTSEIVRIAWRVLLWVKVSGFYMYARTIIFCYRKTKGISPKSTISVTLGIWMVANWNAVRPSMNVTCHITRDPMFSFLSKKCLHREHSLTFFLSALTTANQAFEEQHDIFNDDKREGKVGLPLVLHHKEIHLKLPDLQRVLLYLLENVAADGNKNKKKTSSKSFFMTKRFELLTWKWRSVSLEEGRWQWWGTPRAEVVQANGKLDTAHPFQSCIG